MIKVNSLEKNTIKYNCSCGAVGECMFKAITGGRVIVIDLQCPMCKDTERLKLTKYDSEQERKKLEEDDVDLSWAIVVDNTVKEGTYV
jgi:hypothetical protein